MAVAMRTAAVRFSSANEFRSNDRMGNCETSFAIGK